MNRFVLTIISLTLCLMAYAGSSSTRNANVGDVINVYTTPHSYTQSVLWSWDTSILELQGKLYGSSTSASFKVLKATPSAGSVIQAVTYYYKNGTTSSGVNKDVDTWKVYVKDNGSGSEPGSGSDSDIRFVDLDKTSVTIREGEYVKLTATVHNGYADKFSWSSSNAKVATIMSLNSRNGNVSGDSEGTAIIRVAIDNGSYAECKVKVEKGIDISHLTFTLNSDQKSYGVEQKWTNWPSGEVIIPDKYQGLPVTVILGNAFQNNKDITSVEIPNSVTKIGYTAFSSCSNLISVTIGNSVTSIGDIAFCGCDGLTSVTIPNSVTEIGSRAFNSCRKLQAINVDSANKTYTSRDGVLYNKNMTELIQYPIGHSRTSFAIPNSVTSIGGDAFSYCSNLTSVTIPNSVTSIGGDAFSDCSNLTSVTIPNSVTEIGGYAFYRCSNLTSVMIGNSVTKIGYWAFYDCDLGSIYCQAKTPPTIVNNTFNDAHYASAVLYVPTGTKVAYQAAENWSKFKKIVEMDFTGVDDVMGDGSDIMVAVVNGEICIDGADDRVMAEVYAVNGVCVYRGMDRQIGGFAPGVYVVRVGAKAVKVRL